MVYVIIPVVVVLIGICIYKGIQYIKKLPPNSY